MGVQPQAHQGRAGSGARRHGRETCDARERDHARAARRHRHRHRGRPRRVPRPGRSHGGALHRARDQGDRRGGSLRRPGLHGRSHPRGVRHGRPLGVRPGRRAPRHLGHLLGPARGHERGGARRAEGAREGLRARPPQVHDHPRLLRAGSAGLRGHRLNNRRPGHPRDHDLGLRGGSRRDDERPGRPGLPGQPHRRDQRDPQVRQDRDGPLHRARHRPPARCLHRLRRLVLPRVDARRGRHGQDPHGAVRAHARGLGLAQPARALEGGRRPCRRHAPRLSRLR